LPTASSNTMFIRSFKRALPSVSRLGNFSSLPSECAGWLNGRLALDKFSRNWAVFYAAQPLKQVTRVS
jgi:hypothetical protein